MRYKVIGVRSDGREIELARTWSSITAWQAYKLWVIEYKIYTRVYVIEPWWAGLLTR